jgi:general stress protein 26
MRAAFELRKRNDIMTSHTAEIDRVWEMVETIGTCMLVTSTGGGMRARPMHALADRDIACIWFVTDHRGAKDQEIKESPVVCLAFADTDTNTYLSITGSAEVLRDVAKAKE